MAETSVTKVNSSFSPMGDMGQIYLAASVSMAMRLWRETPPADPKPPSSRPYETVGYVIAGRAELHIEGQTVLLEAGDSWVVPKGSSHTYKITSPFTAVEATHPPARIDDRDDA